MARVVERIDALRALRGAIPGRVGLVPTMGALHEGHLSLVRAARADNDAVLVTIFVNPTQFGQGEDFETYPRDMARDLDLLDAAGANYVFTPTPAMMYPPGFQTWVSVTDVTQGLEGERRPGHFKGVATVVAKLFNLTQPHVAYFGQKDAQQVVVIRRMARDLNFPLEIVVCPTIREPDGLAMSSRNVRLTPEQRQRAPIVYQAMQRAADAYASGERRPDVLRQQVCAVLDAAGVETDYVSLADPRTLQEQREPTDAPLLLSLTARIGSVRLLDNCLLPVTLNTRAGLTATLGAG